MLSGVSPSGKAKIYGRRDPSDVATYSLRDAAHYLHLPVATVRSWVKGRSYWTAQGERHFRPLIVAADPKAATLSFKDLVELHVLSAIRRQHQIRMPAIRKAIDYLRSQFSTDHPLSSENMLTDGKDLFIERYGKLVSVSEKGQMALREILDRYLERIDRSTHGRPLRLYPFTRTQIEAAPRTVLIDPLVQFGRPCLAKRGVPTDVIAERYKAGDSIDFLAEDYGCSRDEIEEAIRYEAAA